MTTFSLATTEYHKDKSNHVVLHTEWHHIVLWNGLANLAKDYLHKSSLIYLEGRLRHKTREDKEGYKKFSVEIVGEKRIMFDKKKNEDNTFLTDQGMDPDWHHDDSENTISF